MQKKPDIQDIYPLSYMQKGMLFSSLMNQGSPFYFQQAVFTIAGPLDTEIFKKSWAYMISRYDVFRTLFLHQGLPEPKQVVLKEREADLVFEDVSHTSRAAADEYAKQYTDSDSRRGFDLSKDVLMRAAVIKTGEQEYCCIWSHHHILMDGWCLGLVIAEFFQIYASFSRNEQPCLAPAKPYSTYIRWLTSREKESAEAYWDNYLLDYGQSVSPPKLSDRSQGEPGHDSLVFRIDERLTQGLMELARTQRVTLNTVFQTLWGVLLQIYHHTDDVVFGAVVSGRPSELEGSEQMIGLFINTVPVRIRSHGETFVELIRKVQQQAYESDEHLYYPLYDIQARSTLKNELITHVIGFENFPAPAFGDAEEQAMGFRVDNFHVAEKTHYDLDITVQPDQEIFVKFSYNTSVYDKDMMLRMERHLKQAIRCVVDQPDIHVNQIDVVDEEERYNLLDGFNQPAAKFPKQPLHRLFEEQVDRAPDLLAVTCDDRTYTYRQLDEVSNRIASCLLGRFGIQQETRIAILLEPSLERAAAIIGALKAGGAYVPIDPDTPKERIKTILEDSGARVVLTSHRYFLQVQEAVQQCQNRIETVCLDQDPVPAGADDKNWIGPRELANYSAQRPDVQVTADQLAYVIYTSGTTGKPKGVMIAHSAAVNLSSWHIRNFTLTQADHCALFAGFGFDAAVWEFFPPLLAGGSLYFVPADARMDIKQLSEFYEEMQITVAFLPTPLCEQFMETGGGYSLRLLLTGGDRLRLFKPQSYQIVNNYGPTENAVVATSYRITSKVSPIPIGQPIDNVQVYVLSKGGKLCPINAAGELCIAGDGLARGYLNEPEMTAESFVDNPFAPGRRMYRTGDLVRWMPDGNLEYLGRLNQQVKIRGFRIELGEIEMHLMQLEDVRDAAAVVKESSSGSHEIWAYVVSDREVSDAELHGELAGSLPSYMIPAQIIQLPLLPQTPNGKVDRKALTLRQDDRRTDAYYLAPRTPLEEKLSEIWKSVLGAERVGIHDHFFELGGDSIKGIQFQSRLHKERLQVAMKDLFRYPTIAQLVPWIQSSDNVLPEGSESGAAELTPAMSAYFFKTAQAEKHPWHNWTHLFRRDKFDELAIRNAWSQLITRHDALRLVFMREGERVVGRIRNYADASSALRLDIISCNGMIDSEELDLFMKREVRKLSAALKPEQGPMSVLGLFRTEAGDHLWMGVHGLAADSTSMQVLHEDFLKAYDYELNGQQASFGPVGLSFQAWSNRIARYPRNRKPNVTIPDWKLSEQEVASTLFADLRTERRRASGTSIHEISLSENETKLMLTDAQYAYRTEFSDLLLTAWGLCLAEWTGVPEIRTAVELEISSRTGDWEELDVARTVGSLTSLCFVPLLVRKDRELGASIKAVKETLRACTRYADAYRSLQIDVTNADVQVQPDIRFRDWGRFESGSDTSGVVIVGAHAGIPAALPSAGLTINRVVVDDKLRFFFEYHEEDLQTETLQRLVELFLHHLRLVANYCLLQQASESTPSDLGTAELAEHELAQWRLELAHFAPDSEIERIYPLSPLQEGMLFHARFDSESAAYLDQMTLSFRGNVDIGRLKDSFDALMARHEILRTVFRYNASGRPMQAVLSQRIVPFHFEDLQNMPAASLQASHIEAYRQKDREKGFDLSSDEMMRVAVFALEESVYQVVWSYHHIILDGWCLGILIQEFYRIYEALERNAKAELPPAQPYRRFIDWLGYRNKEEAAAYWDRYLDGYDGQADIPVLRKHESAAAAPYALKSLEFVLEPGMTKELEKFARQNQATVNTLLQTAWGLVLAKYNHSTDVVFGTVVSGRPSEIPGVETMVGLFINTIPVRVKLHPSDSLAEVLQSMQRRALESAAHDWFPLADLKSERKTELVRHLFVFENYPLEEQVKEGRDASFEISYVDLFEQTNFDFNLIVLPGSKELRFNMSYNASIFEEEELRNVWKHLLHLLKQFSNPQRRIEELTMLSAEERKAVMAFNATETSFPREATLDGLFAERAAQSPDRVALEHGNQSLTYGELAAQAEQWARALTAQGVRHGDRVGLIAGRGFGAVVGMLAILQAGAAYVPIEPEYPVERQSHVAAHAQVRALLTDAEPVFDAGDLPVVRMDLPLAEGWAEAELPQTRSAGDLAYIIYTSGSTGLPKGVMIEHRSAVNLIHWVNETYDVGVEDRLLWVTSMCFDLSVYDVFGLLAAGGTVVVVEKEQVQEPRQLWELMVKRKITFWDSVPTTMNYFVQNLEEQGWTERQSELRLVFLSGDWIPVNLKDRLQAYFPQARVCGLGGATEAAVWSNSYPIERVAAGQRSIPYGKPLSNNEFYILDPFGELTPKGVAGELYIGGIGVARGYMNDEVKTEAAFVANPFRPGEKMYRTGDLGRLQQDGNMEFLGRKDQQVKVRGYRIELGEIEYWLMQHDKVREAVVVVRSEGGAAGQLCAYVVPEGDSEATAEELRAHLAKTLTDYMLPAYVTRLKELPLSANGKIDRKALPAPEGSRGAGSMVRPRTEMERKLSAIWTELLGLEEIGVSEDFFMLGGHSLLAATMAARITAELGVELPLPLVFRHATIEGLSARLEEARQLRGTPERPVTLLNDGGEGSHQVFCFPPVAGYGFEYKGLADRLPEYTWYAFDFHTEGEDSDRAERYAAWIRELKPVGPYTLLGYSAGGNVAFETARALEADGQQVDEVLILDAQRKMEAVIQSDAELERETNAQLDAAMVAYGDLLAIPSLRKEAALRMIAYRHYLNGIVNVGPIQAHIRIVLAESSMVSPSWADSTKSVLTIHQGSGSHIDMLVGEAAAGNAAILRELLSAGSNATQ